MRGESGRVTDEARRRELGDRWGRFGERKERPVLSVGNGYGDLAAMVERRYLYAE